MALSNDLRQGTRTFVRNPGFALTAIVALALGMGANSAVLSAVYAVLVKPLPYADPDRVVMVWEDATRVGFPRNTPAPANFVDWKRQNTVFSDMAATRGRAGNLTGAGDPEYVMGRGVTWNFFPLLGTRPLLGRTFTADEDRPDARVMVISHGLWQRRFGGDASVVGREVELNGAQTRVIGVMPRSFYFAPGRTVDYWVPAGFSDREWSIRGGHFLNVVARLKRGASVSQAQAEMSTIAKRLEQAYPDTNDRVGAVVVPVRQQVAGDTGTALLVLFAASACVLLIACANVANLLLARATGRRREIAVRVALGAGRGRLVGHMLAETLVLAAAALPVSLTIAAGGIAVLEKLIPPTMAAAELALDWRLMTLTLAIGMLAAVVAGTAPALSASRVPVAESLKQGGGKATSGAGAAFSRRALVAGQVALAIVLLVGAGLLLRSFAAIRGIDPGFNPENLLTARTILPQSRYADPALQFSWAERVLTRVRTLPGVRGAAFTSNLPFTARGNTSGFRIEGRPPERGLSYDALYRVGTSEYLKVLGVRLREGRIFGDSDGKGTQPVVVINDHLARSYFPGEGALGRRIQFTTGERVWYTVVGVIDEVRERGFEADIKPAAYLLLSQVDNGFYAPQWLAVRTAGNPMSIVGGVRASVSAADPAIAFSTVRTMEEMIDLEVGDRQRQLVVLGALAVTALVLACVGLYGVLAYTVSQRTREIGVRVALGATRFDVLRRVAGDGLSAVIAGGVLGLLAAGAVTRGMRTLLFGVAPLDPATYGAVAAALLAVALLACAIPARRAVSVDPVVALREE